VTVCSCSGGAAWADLARLLAWRTSRDRDARAATTAFARALERLSPPGPTPRAEPALRLAAADATDDDDERRRLLEQALEARPPPQWRALLLARLGVAARAARRDTKALEAWREALAIDPACWAASLGIAQEEADAGLPQTAVARLEALAPPSRALQRVQRTAVRLYDAAGRQREADRVLAALARDRRRDTDLMHQLSIRARRRGDGDDARTRLAAVVALRPDIPSLEIELGRLLEGAGEGQRALATLKALADRLPDEPSALVALGKLLHRQGKADEAQAPLHTALVLRPQDPELKRYLDRLSAGAQDDLGVPDEPQVDVDVLTALHVHVQPPGARALHARSGLCAGDPAVDRRARLAPDDVYPPVSADDVRAAAQHLGVVGTADRRLLRRRRVQCALGAVQVDRRRPGGCAATRHQ